jgi:DNA invertase Pin-like site-specific DNA recombinase
MTTQTGAVAYVRLSLDKDGSQLGVARQEEEIRALAKSEGIPVGRVFADNSVSAFSGASRPAYEAMRAAAKRQEFSILYVYATDRLYRRLSDLEELVNEFETAGVTVRSVKSGRINLATADGRLHARLLAAVAQHESEKKSERIVSRNRQRTTVERKSSASQRPFGLEFTSEPSVFAVHPTEGAAVQEVFRRFNNGESMRQIAIWLNESGFTGTSGSPFAANRVSDILTNCRYAGLVKWRGQIVGESKGDPALVTRADYESAQTRLATNVKRGRPQSSLFGGLSKLKCGLCQGNLTHSSNKRKDGKELTYACQNAREVARKRESIDNTVLLTIDTWLTARRERLLEAFEQSLSGSNAEVEALEQRLAALAGIFASGGLNEVDYAATVNEIRKRLTALSVPASVADPLEQARKAAREQTHVLSLPLAAQRALVTELVDTVVIGKGRGIEAIDINWTDAVKAIGAPDRSWLARTMATAPEFTDAQAARIAKLVLK